MSESISSIGPADPLFATTAWTMVTAAGSNESELSNAALDRLSRIYWYPVYAHIRRRYQREDAQDLTQDFFCRLLARRPFKGLGPEKGRFRSFLLACVKNYLADEHDRRNTLKRGSGRTPFSLEQARAEQHYDCEPAANDTPEKEFDRRWVLAVLTTAMEALGHDEEEAGRKLTFERLRPFLTDTAEARDYSRVALELQTSPNNVAVLVRRLRGRYRELVRKTVAETLLNPQDVESEMENLLNVLRS